MKKRLNLQACALALLLIGATVQSAPLYKCDIGGSLAFQDTPCPPTRTKQKVACADIDGFADYKEALNEACANLAAGKPINHEFGLGSKQKPKATKSSARGVKPSNTTAKEVFVRGYTKEDGTRVPSYTRNMPEKSLK